MLLCRFIKNMYSLYLIVSAARSQLHGMQMQQQPHHRRLPAALLLSDVLLLTLWLICL